MKKIFILTICTFLLSGLHAQTLKLASIFADDMVLQQNDQVPIWGWTNSGGEVTIIPSWGDTIKINAEGTSKWKTTIPTPDGSYTPHSIQIIGSSKAQSIFIQNILIGEVWLASGQSNMEWNNTWLRVDNYKEEVGSANLPNLRFFKVNLKTNPTPLDDLWGAWNVCTPDVMMETSGTGYYFAKHLQDSLKVPVGVIVDAWGGTPIEFWYPEESFSDQEELVKSTNKQKEYMWFPASQTGWGYNAMTYPMEDFSIAGIIWYQGESNATDPELYADKMEVLINERRKQFNRDLPFYYVQIAPYRYNADTRSEVIRDEQRLAQRISNTGMIVTSDIGDTVNIHPSNKKDVGLRLANLALKYHYEVIEGLVESPVFKSAVFEKKYVDISFQYGEGLYFDGEERGLFQVAGNDGVFKTVKAKIIDGKVRLDTRKIDSPQQVQFAFTNTATPVLFNGAKLPASCFGPQKIK